MTITDRAPDVPTSAVEAALGPPSRWRQLREPERYVLLLIWAAMFAVFAAIAPELFLRANTVAAIFSSADVYVLLGLAALLPLYVGEFDLSIPYSMGLAATVLVVSATEWGLPLGLSVVLALVTSVAAGGINAFFVVRLGVDPLITTLGTGAAFLGFAMALADSKPVSGLPSAFSALATTRVLGLTATFWYGVVLVLIVAYVLYRTPTGRRMTFVGSSREVSRLAGVRVDRIRAGSYIAGNLVAGVAGILLTAKVGGFDPASSSGYLLPTFATVFVSAAVFTLGRFNPLGVLVGAYFIATGSLGLQLLGISGWSQQVFYGASLVFAVAAVSWARRRLVRRR